MLLNYAKKQTKTEEFIWISLHIKQGCRKIIKLDD